MENHFPQTMPRDFGIAVDVDRSASLNEGLDGRVGKEKSDAEE